MRTKISFLLAALLLFTGSAFAEQPTLPQQPPSINTLPELKKSDRVLILAPHPDDEAIGCAGVIQQALRVGANVHVAYLTNGDHNQVSFIVYEKRLTIKKAEFIHMGEVRRQEAVKAMKLLGLNESNLIFLGYPDFGTFTIFCKYWQSKKPYKSLLTRITSVPYKENLSFGSPYTAESILTDLKKVLLAYKPNKIFVSHPVDTNPDHKSFYLFLQVALLDLEKDLLKPEVYPYLVHCVGWPLPRHYHPELALLPPEKLSGIQINWLSLNLSKEESVKKYEAINCYKSQTLSAAFYLLAFARNNELFGDFPEIALKRQASFNEQPVLFSGHSKMFADYRFGVFSDAEKLAESKGESDYSITDNYLLIRIRKAKEIHNKLSVQIYLFGYSIKTPFALMPKINIIVQYDRLKVIDGKRVIKPEGVSVKIEPEELILKVPLSVLGDPSVILSSIKSYNWPLIVHATGFRKLVIKDAGG
jgi:LmbE family N-acetylglucosaminyl deacetylase